jgi:hypothetical protein
MMHEEAGKWIPELMHHFGNAIKDMRECRLRRDFPHRFIEVHFHADDSESLVDG